MIREYFASLHTGMLLLKKRIESKFFNSSPYFCQVSNITEATVCNFLSEKLVIFCQMMVKMKNLSVFPFAQNCNYINGLLSVCLS